jgi:hypothetical protein
MFLHLPRATRRVGFLVRDKAPQFLHTTPDTDLSQALLLIRAGIMPHSPRRVRIERHGGDEPSGEREKPAQRESEMGGAGTDTFKRERPVR